MYGRGAYDMKAGLAAIMWAGAEAARSPPGRRRDRVRRVRRGVRQHRRAGAGRAAGRPTRRSSPSRRARRCASRWRTRASRGTRSRCAASRRTARGRRTASTRSRGWAACSSASTRWPPISRRAEPHPLLGNGSVHASLIEGGRELSTYPDRCLLAAGAAHVAWRDARGGRGRAGRDPRRDRRTGDPTFEAGTRTTLVRPWLETRAMPRSCRRWTPPSAAVPR